MRWLYRRRGLLRALSVAILVLLAVVLLARAVGALAGWLGPGVLLGVAVLLGVVASRVRRWVPRRTWLEVDLERGVVEQAPPRRAFTFGTRGPLVLRDVLDALERAGDDPRVRGVVARVGRFRPGLAVAQELRDAVLALRKKGKRAVAWAETLGEGESASVETFLASSFDEVHLQPGGLVGFDGVMARSPFAKGALEKAGVDPQLGHRREYKTARNLFTERAFTEPHRESLQAIVDDAAGQIVDGIAAGRGLDAAVVRAAMDRGPFTAKEALEARLVDRLSYRDEVYGALRTGERARFLHLERYLRRAGRPYRKGALVALVHAVGAIHRGTAGPSSASIGSDDVTAALRRAARSKRVKAILFRVDSGGGSAVASEAIWREVARARERKKPVVVSMGNVAGSGGYYVACGADRIVASPATLTGSIGVVWGKFVTREAWRKVGVTWDALKVGEHADLWSPAHDLGDAGWAKLEGHLDTIYEDFKAKVAAGRGMSPEQVEEVAKGRVWTGARAKDLRLIDGLGGLRTALDVVREVAGLPAGSPLRIRTFHPRRRRFPFGAGGEEGSEEALRAVRGALAGVDPAFALAFDALGAPRGPLVVPPLDLSTAAPPRV